MPSFLLPILRFSAFHSTIDHQCRDDKRKSKKRREIDKGRWKLESYIRFDVYWFFHSFFHCCKKRKKKNGKREIYHVQYWLNAFSLRCLRKKKKDFLFGKFWVRKLNKSCIDWSIGYRWSIGRKFLRLLPFHRTVYMRTIGSPTTHCLSVICLTTSFDFIVIS